MNNFTPNKSEQAQFSVRDIAGVLFRHKALIITTFLTIALGTAVLTLLMPNEYESRMKILVKNARSDVPITPERTTGTAGTYFDNEVSENQINSEIELLTSDDLLKQVVTECALYQPRASLSVMLGLRQAPATQAAQIEEAGQRLAKDLVITPVKKANIIEVKYTSGSPQLAATVLRKVQDLYLEKHLKLHRPPGTYDFFKNQATQSEDQLRDAQKQLSTFQQSMNVVSLTQQKERADSAEIDRRKIAFDGNEGHPARAKRANCQTRAAVANYSSAHCDAKPRTAESILGRAPQHDDCRIAK
jgi:succinoglycan biosynthesis transport protein ExoP